MRLLLKCDEARSEMLNALKLNWIDGEAVAVLLNGAVS